MRASTVVAAALLASWACSGGSPARVEPVPADELGRRLPGDWLVLATPRDSVTVGWALAPGGAWERACYVTGRVRSAGYDRYQGARTTDASLGFGARLLSGLGVRLDGSRSTATVFETSGWSLASAADLRPDFTNRDCMDDTGVPAFPAVTAALSFDTLRIVGSAGARLVLDAGTPQVGGRVEVAGNGSMVTSGVGLTVGMTLTYWRRRGTDFDCEEPFTIIIEAPARQVCPAAGRPASDYRFAVRRNGNRYDVRVVDARPGGTDTTFTGIEIGSRIPLEMSAQRYTRVILDQREGEPPDEVVALRLLRTSYDRQEVRTAAALSPQMREAVGRTVLLH